jgi:hypothetical protein
MRAAAHVVMAGWMAAALRGRGGAAAALPAAAWLALEVLAGDARLLFPFSMACAGAAAWRWRWRGAVAAGAAFLLMRWAAGADAAVLRTELAGTSLCLAAALAARRAGAGAAAAAASLAGLAALLL